MGKCSRICYPHFWVFWVNLKSQNYYKTNKITRRGQSVFPLFIWNKQQICYARMLLRHKSSQRTDHLNHCWNSKWLWFVCWGIIWSIPPTPPQRISAENNTSIMARRILSVVQVRELGDGNSQRGLEHKAARDFTLHHGCNPWGRNTELTCETALPTSYREAGHDCNKSVVGPLSVINQLWWLDVIRIANAHLQLKLAVEAAGLWVQMRLF